MGGNNNPVEECAQKTKLILTVTALNTFYGPTSKEISLEIKVQIFVMR
jgi:hypothetical protein